jgi:hypothetical protein
MATSAKIDFSKINLSGRDLEIAKACIGRDGGLRSSKPKDGEAAYVWRMAAFTISTNPKHHCMPVTAEFDLPEQYWGPGRSDARHARIKELDVIEMALVDAVPKEQWYGVRRWAGALGLV